MKQLDRYLLRPHGERPFYVFPRPHWTGELTAAAPLDGVPATEVGFRRADHLYLSTTGWWFRDWLIALTTDQVAHIVRNALAAYRAGTATSDSVTLVTFDLSSGHRVTTWADRSRHRTIPWLTLWERLDGCGAASWPQLVRLPASVLGRRSGVRHAALAGLLAEATDSDNDLITLTSTEDGIFRPLTADERPRDTPSEDTEEEPDHRILAFLGRDALRLG